MQRAVQSITAKMATGGPIELSCTLVDAGDLKLKSASLLDLSDFVVSGDMLIVADWRASNIQVYRRHDGFLLATSDKLQSRPSSICFINDKEISVTSENSTIEIMSVEYNGDTGTITKVRTLHANTTFDECDGVERFHDNVVVSGWKEDNSICCCIVSLNNGTISTIHQVCKGDVSYLTINENVIYISCYAADSVPDNTGVYGYYIQNPSKQTFRYKHKELKQPRGITVDNNACVFVCNWDPPCIHHLTDKCELVTIYTEGIPPHPQDISFDQGIMHVMSNWSNVVQRYRLVYSHQQGDFKTPQDLKSVKGKLPAIEETSNSDTGLEDKKQIPPNVLPQQRQATERFTRVFSLLIDVGTKVLRKVLIHYTTTSSLTIDQYLKNKEPDIRNLKRRKVLTEHQVDIIFPQSGQTDIYKYDITLALALLNNVCPSIGQQEKQIITDLRTERNILVSSHSTKMSEKDFQTKWTDITTILTDLSKLCKDPNFDNQIQNEIQDIQRSGSDEITSKMIETKEELKRLYKLLEDIDTTQNHKLRDVQTRDERKQPVIGETSTLIGQGTEKGLPSEQVQRFSEDDKQGGYGATEFERIYERKEPVVKETARDIGYRSECEEQVGKSTEMKYYPVCTQRIMSPTCPKDLTHLSKQLSEILMKKEKNAKFIVWPGTNLANNMAVFVCLYHGVMQKTEQTYEGIDIYYKDSETPSRPLEPPHKIPIDSELNLCHKDAELLQQAIEEHGHDLFKQHSNIEAITGSSFNLSYSKGCIKCPSIVLYCRVKGIAPIGEAAFPTMLTIAEESISINVDVREGYLRQGMYRESSFCKTDWHDRLRMGISIGVKHGSQGTLGPFVKINDKDTGFLTCAHVILSDPMDQRALVESVGCEVFQPADGESPTDFEKHRDERYCGVVSKIVFNPKICDPMNGLSKTVGVDAALVTVRGKRVEDVRSFPFIADKDLRNAGFEPTHPPMFGHGLVLKNPLDFKKCQGERVIKYGRTSGLTVGRISMNGAMIKVDDAILQLGRTREHVTMKGQYIIERVGKPIFFASGDSGSAVFMVDAENKLTCIGLAIGYLDDFQTVVTPIEYVLKALGLPLDSMNFEENMDVQEMPETNASAACNILPTVGPSTI